MSNETDISISTIVSSDAPQNDFVNPSSASSASNTDGTSFVDREEEKPSFSYDLEVFNLCKKYLKEKNHHGLALIARQKGIPPFLRFKVWPILLKYHPFVVNPFIQPDTEVIDEVDNNEEKKTNSEDGGGRSSSSSFSSKSNDSSKSSTPGESSKEDVRASIRKDLDRYVKRLKFTSDVELSDTELQIFDIIENSVYKFISKWGKIIKYDEALSWIALNLAEWFPPINNTPWVLVGRENSNKNTIVKSILQDYSYYIDSIEGLHDDLNALIDDQVIVNMSFHDVYERLVLVLLHSPEEKPNTQSNKKGKMEKFLLPINGGTIEERVSFFIYCLRKLLPELSQFFSEEHILNKFGNYDDQWLIWWLKYCGSKVWNKFDRGRIWDRLLGWRAQNPKKGLDYYMEKLNFDKDISNKMGADIFWSVSNEEGDGDTENEGDLGERSNSFTSLIKKLKELNYSNVSKKSQLQSSSPTSSAPVDSFPDITIPFAKVDPHVELIFISLALLKAQEHTLVELDQHEIRQFLSRLPSKSYKYKQKKQHTQSANIISNDSLTNHTVYFIDNIIVESGELWRKWQWSEMN